LLILLQTYRVSLSRSARGAKTAHCGAALLTESLAEFARICGDERATEPENSEGINLSLRRRTGADEKGIRESYYEAFVLALVMCLSPFKALAYAAPFLAGSWFLYRSRSLSGRRRARRVLASALGLVVTYWLFRAHYSMAAGLLAIVTYGTFFLLVIIPTESLASKDLLDRMTGLVGKVLIVEAIVGIAQALVSASRSGGFDLSNGDAVQGTIHLSFISDGSFSNPIYAANMTFFLLALAPYLMSKKRRVFWPILLGTVALILASVIHMILFAAVGLMFALLLFHPSLPRKMNKFQLVSAVVLGPVLAIAVLSDNLRNITYQAGLFAGGDLPKAVMVYRALYEMPHDYPAMPLVGLGPGQFSSRASLISTGRYFGGLDDPKTVPLIRENVSPALDEYLADLWVDASDVQAYGGSSSAKPFFSWMSVYTELGAPALVGVFVYALLLLRRMKVSAQSSEQKWLAVCSGAGVCFLLLVGFQENYWEVPQALLTGLMLVQVMYANIVYQRKVREQNTTPLATVEP
jgi:hypothetical protein